MPLSVWAVKILNKHLLLIHFFSASYAISYKFIVRLGPAIISALLALCEGHPSVLTKLSPGMACYNPHKGTICFLYCWSELAVKIVELLVILNVTRLTWHGNNSPEVFHYSYGYRWSHSTDINCENVISFQPCLRTAVYVASVVPWRHLNARPSATTLLTREWLKHWVDHFT